MDDTEKPILQGRTLNERDTLRVIVLAIKHIDTTHHDWKEIIAYSEKFDASGEYK